MFNPVQILHNEHKVLLEAVETTKEVQRIKEDKQYRILIHDLILFFRNFSEIYHHPKEEHIFYPLIKNRVENINDYFIYELGDNHNDFRAMISEMENYFENCDYPLLRNIMDTYLAELKEHIEKEEKEVLYVSANLLRKNEIEKVCEEFKTLDEKLGKNEKSKLERIIQNINQQLSKI